MPHSVRVHTDSGISLQQARRIVRYVDKASRACWHEEYGHEQHDEEDGSRPSHSPRPPCPDAAAPADAQRYRGRYHRDNGGTAIVAGIAGLAIGAAIASNGRDRYRDSYYSDRGYPRDYDYNYYRQRGYYPNNGYYAQQYRGRYDSCRIERRWDGYSHRNVRVRVCY